MSTPSGTELLLAAAPADKHLAIPSSPRRRLLIRALTLGVLLVLLLVGLTLGVVIGAAPSNLSSSTPSPSPLESITALPIIRVTGGLVSGAVLPRGQALFAGVPFAAPPVGPLRWLPPRPVVPWSGVRDASQLPPYCAQLGPSGVLGVEDCLYLNVYTPRVLINGTVRNATLAPVLVYIHGGSSLIGWSGWPTNDQRDLVASRDVVTVTANYRLNVFGYLALDALSERQRNVTGHRSSGNWGLEDLLAALHWVQANIAAFGGDPNRVTLWGQSTGGTNVMALYVSPLAKGLFHAAVSLSGSPILRGALREAEAVNAEFVDNADCGGLGTDDATVDCLLALPTDAAAYAVPSRWLSSYDTGFPNRHWPDAPVMIVDGRVVPLELNAALRTAGATVDVPLVYGHMANEVDMEPMADLRAYSTQAQWGWWLKSNLPPLGWNMSHVTRIAAAYPISDYDDDVMLTYETLVNDIIRCGGVRNLRNAVQGVTAPVHHFLDFHRPARPLCYLCFTGLISWNVSYAGHMWDQLMLLRSYPPGYSPSREDAAGTALLRSFLVDQLASTLSLNDSQWQPFTSKAMMTGTLYRNGSFAAVRDLRWDKCQLIDGLGLAEFAWSN